MLLLFQNNGTFFDTQVLTWLAPELILAAAACLVLVMEVVLPYRKSKLTGYFTLVGLGLSAASLVTVYLSNSDQLPLIGFGGMLRVDGFAFTFKGIFLLAAILAVALSIRYLDVEQEQHGEYYSLILMATIGMMFLGSGYDFIILYISLELMAITFYILVAFTKRQRRSNEAGMKYFLLGAFSSGILLYGMSLLYGITGSTNLLEIGNSVTRTGGAVHPLLILSMIALAAGLFFKVAAVPFHMWAPDAYEGAPTAVTAFLSTGSKVASFVLYARIFSVCFASAQNDWGPLLGIVAALTIFVGNWAAVTQENSKRLLAYSSISNAGYLLLGLIANNLYGYLGLVIYLLVYTLMNMGAFGVIISLCRRGITGDNVEDMAGLGKKAPGVAAMMSIFMLSLGGLPGTGGFIGKYFLLWGLMQRGETEHKTWYYWLAGWAVINIVISFYYYIRFIKVMYLGDREADDRPLALSVPLNIAMVVALIGVLAIGLYPQPLIALTQKLTAPVVHGSASEEP
jgi:NADH-quinone oxidoreductase subunit N